MATKSPPRKEQFTPMNKYVKYALIGGAVYVVWTKVLT